MAIRTAKTNNDPEQPEIPELQVETIEDKRAHLTRKMAEYFIQEHRIQKIRGELKLENNALKEIKAELKDMTVDVEKGQLELIISDAQAQVGNDLTGQVMDLSNVKTPEELRQQSSFTQSLQDSLDEFENREDDEE